jgi:glucokinase
MLEAKTRIPAAVENDVNLAALGERWDGTARGVKNFVFLTVGSGVGAGIFLDGSLYHGSDWAAGEIGYLYVPGTEDAPLAIYRHGSLESIIGARAIEEAWRKLCETDHATSRRFPAESSVTEIFDLAANGESRAAAILKRAARTLADAITDVCVILNIPLLVIGGRVGSHPALFEATRQIIEQNEFSRPRLALSGLGLKAPLHGALRLALNLAGTLLLPSSFERSRVLTSEGLISTVMPIPSYPRSDVSR